MQLVELQRQRKDIHHGQVTRPGGISVQHPMSAHQPSIPHWREQIQAAVSPFESGVQQLRVDGYRPPGVCDFRPKKTAAVLVPVLSALEPEIVLTRRADHLTQHAGQVSFPGGAAEDRDGSAVQTALREAFEEIGLPSECTTPIGFLDRMDTISDYRVLPVVAVVERRVIWKLDRSEVAEVFTVPLSFALDKSQYSPMNVKRDGAEWTIWTLEWQNYRIWGVTAAILFNLATRFERALET